VTDRPFPPGYRGAGVLLHVTALPSRHGIGDLGPSAFRWIDRLHEAGLRWWQGLPVGPTGWGDSPYQSLSSFAGNGLLISPDRLVEEGLLQAGECDERFPALFVDYDTVIPYKHRLLDTAWRRFEAGARPDLQDAFGEFCARQAGWLDDYALFRALKVRHQGCHYLEWPTALVQRRPAALARARHEAADEVQRVRFAQFLLSRQAADLEAYAHAHGIGLIGDLPFFVSPDSSDVWANPELFLLDAERRPRVVAGVPPDAFAVDGQLWGNPIYDWAVLRATGYRWWIDRVRALLAHVDLVRLDHFRAFAQAWHVPTDATTARSGRWMPGPGADLVAVAARELDGMPFIAEDLGVITPDVEKLRDDFALPGTRVLQFAFEGDERNPHLPHNHPANAVVYTGTHDNETTRGWYDGLPEAQRRRVWSYLGRPRGDTRCATAALLALAWSSPAALAIAPFQDVLNLGNEARINVPGRAEGNWRWRCTSDTLAPAAFESLRELTATSRRRDTGRSPLRRGVADVASVR
jgi:4-alpha-glucanotransferase